MTAGPNDEASPTIQVGALDRPIANDDEADRVEAAGEDQQDRRRAARGIDGPLRRRPAVADRPATVTAAIASDRDERR